MDYFAILIHLIYYWIKTCPTAQHLCFPLLSDLSLGLQLLQAAYHGDP